MNLSLPVNQTRQCPLVISKVTKWKWKMCLLRHCFDFERVRHATWLHKVNRDLPKSTLCMNSWWLGTAEVSYKKAHILVEVEMSSHLFFCKLK